MCVCVREGQTAHRQEILQLWELISGMHVLSQMKAAQITHWMRPANHTQKTKNTLSTHRISIRNHQAIDIFSMSHKVCFWNKTSFISSMLRAFDELNKLQHSAHVKLTAALLQRDSLGAKQTPNHSKNMPFIKHKQACQLYQSLSLTESTMVLP